MPGAPGGASPGDDPDATRIRPATAGPAGPDVGPGSAGAGLLGTGPAGAPAPPAPAAPPADMWAGGRSPWSRPDPGQPPAQAPAPWGAPWAPAAPKPTTQYPAGSGPFGSGDPAEATSAGFPAGSAAAGAGDAGSSGYGTQGFAAQGYGPSGHGPSGHGPSGYGPSGYAAPGYGGPGGPDGSNGSNGSGGYGGGSLVEPRGRPGGVSRRLIGVALALALVSAGVGGAVGALVAHNQGSSSAPVSSDAGLSQSNGSSSSGVSPAASGTVAAAAKTVLPSTVTIAEESSQEAGTGSGVIIRADGYILTNNHVVSAAANGGSLTVTTQDGKNYSAQITGTDPSSDLAVVKINATGLNAVTFGDSDKLTVGELVVAVGSPLGLNGTVTSGIVSALHRPTRTGDSSVQDQNAVLDAIQTDAPINPGNSGGPLVDSGGRLVGINSAIATVGSGGGGPFGGGQQQQQSGNIGVGFAIPADYARTIAEELITKGSATHPYLGVSVSTESPNGVTGDGTGAVVREMVTGGPAAKAGLKVGDVVTKVNDRAVTSTDGLIAAIRSHSIGEAVTVTYQRDGRTLSSKVTLTQQP